MSDDIKIVLSAELDKASVGNIKKELEGIKDSVDKIKLDVDANDVAKQIAAATKTEPVKIDVDTGNAKSQLVDLNGSMSKFYTTSVTAMQGADGSAQKYVKTMYNADRSVKLVTTSMRDMNTGKFTEVGRTVTDNLVKPMQDAQVEALKLNKNFDKVSQGLKGELSNSLSKVTRDFKEVASPETAKNIQDMIKSLDFSSSTFDDDVKRIKNSIKEFGDESKIAANEIKTLGRGSKDMDGLSHKLAKLSSDFKGIVNPADIARVQEMIKALNPKSLTYSTDVAKINQEMRILTENSRNTQKGLREASTASDTFGQSIQNTLKKAVGWVSLTMAIRTFIRQLKKGVEAIKEIDSGMVELRKVTNATEEEYASFATTAFEAGRLLGRSGTEVINATADFARMGFELKEATGLAKEALLMMNVGDGIENLDQATKSMIATLKGFKVESEDSVAAARKINDSYNEVSNNFAIDTGNLAEGIRRISAIMRSSGNDMNETIGMITGGFEVMQDTRKVSSGLNIIAQRLKGISDVGEETIDLLPTLKEQFMQIAGINLEKPNGEMKNTYQILSEMAEIFPTLTDRQRNFLTELSAGKRQSVVLESILQNWKNVEAATLTATYSMGSALIEQEVYLDSIEGKMSQLSATTEGFWNKVIDSSSVKEMIDMAAQFVRAAGDIVESMGGIESIAMVVVPIIGVKLVGALSKSIKAANEFNTVAKSLDAINGTVAASSQGMATGINATKTASDGAKGSMLGLTAVMMGLQAALILVPAAIMMIKNAELKRKRAVEDSIAAFEKQEEQTAVLLEIADAYEELGNKQNKTAQETQVLEKLKERMMSLSPEVASAIEGENKSYSEQADLVRGIAEEQEKLAKLKAHEILADYSEDIDNIKKKLKAEEEYYTKTMKLVQDYERSKAEALKSGEQFDSANEGLYKIWIKGLSKSLEKSEKYQGVLDSVKGAMVTLGMEVDDTSGSVDDLDSNMNDLVASEMEAEEVTNMLNDSMRDSKAAMDEAEFGTSEYTNALRDAIDAQKELNGINDESKQEGKRDHIEAIAAKYKAEEEHIKNINKAKEELNETGQIEYDTQTKLGEKNIELIDIRGKTSEEARKLLEKDVEVAKARMELYDAEVTASANNASKYDMIYDGVMGSSDAVKESLLQAVRDIEEGAKSIDEIWEGLPEETKDLIVALTGSEDVEEGMGEIMEMFLNSPENKDLIINLNGAELVEKDIEALSETWGLLENEEKVFVTRVLGEGLENIPGFEKMWDGLTEEEKEYAIKAFADGVANVENFEEMWDNLTDEEKFFAIKATADGANETEEFNEYWKGMSPGKKKFIAESVGIQDVKDANNETMNSWAENPLVKWFIAEYDGLEEVRIEQGLTDGQWKLHVGDRQYTSKEFGAKTTRDAIKRLTDYWNTIPRNDTKTKTIRSVNETINRISNEVSHLSMKAPKNSKAARLPSTKWTGDSNFKGGLSFVGEKGRELLIYPNGTQDMTGETAELRNLPQGTRIFNNPDTELILKGKKIPKFASGNAKAETVSKTDFAKADRYEYINIQLNKQNHLLEKNRLLQERLKDNSIAKVKLLTQEIELEKQHNRLLNSKLIEQIKDRDKQETALRKEGFKFKGSGYSKEITNLSHISGKTKEVEEIFNKFNELQFSTIPQIQAEILKSSNDISAAVSEGYLQQTKISNYMRENEHLLSMNAIYQARAVEDQSELLRLMREEVSLQQKKAYLTKDQNDQNRIERNELEQNLKRYGAKFDGSGDNKRIKNPNFIKGKSVAIEEMLNRYQELQLDIIPSVKIDHMGVEDAIKNIEKEIKRLQIDSDLEVMDDSIKALQKIQEIIQYNIDMLDSDDIKERLKLTKDLYSAEEDYNKQVKSNIVELKSKMIGLKETDSLWKDLNNKVEQYEKDLRVSNLELEKMKDNITNISKENLEVKFDASLEEVEGSLFGGKTAQEVQDAFNKKQEQQRLYLEGLEKELAVSKILRSVEEDELKLTREQRDILNSSGKIRKDSLEKIEKELAIQKAQVNLENLRDQKTIRQLKKQSDGSWDFEYTADMSAVREAEQELEDRQNELLDWEKEYSNAIEKESIDNRIEYLSKLEDMLKEALKGDLKSIEEFYRELEKVNKDFVGNLADNSVADEWANIINNMDTILDKFIEDFESHLKDSASDIIVGDMVEVELQAKKPKSKTLNSIVPDFDVDFMSMVKSLTTKGVGNFIANLNSKSIAVPEFPKMSTDNSVSQVFNIDSLDFPNVTNSKEIENAISSLSTHANQWANKRK